MSRVAFRVGSFSLWRDKMAATRLIPLHVNKGKTAAQSLADRIDYAVSPDKTEQGLYVRGYACEPETCT